jgi:hypothetical protein
MKENSMLGGLFNVSTDAYHETNRLVERSSSRHSPERLRRFEAKQKREKQCREYDTVVIILENSCCRRKIRFGLMRGVAPQPPTSALNIRAEWDPKPVNGLSSWYGSVLSSHDRRTGAQGPRLWEPLLHGIVRSVVANNEAMIFYFHDG